MRRYRRNADARIRALERAAAQGDPEAQSRLLLEHVRTGELPLRNLWFAAVLGEEAAARAVGWRPPEWVEPIANVFAFLNRSSKVLFPEEHQGSFKRRRPPWPKLTPRQQHTFSAALAWASAASVRGIAITGLQQLVARAADLNAIRAPDDWDDWAREASWFDLIRDNVEAMVDTSKACVFGERNLRTLKRMIRGAWGGETARDIHYMIQGLHHGEYYNDPPVEDSLNHAKYADAEAPRDMLDGVDAPAGIAAGFAGYMSALSAVRACASRIGKPELWALPIVVGGWLRDADLGGIDGLYDSASGFAADAYVYAVAAWGVLHTSALESMHLGNPDAQLEVRRAIQHALIPPLLEGRL